MQTECRQAVARSLTHTNSSRRGTFVRAVGQAISGHNPRKSTAHNGFVVSGTKRKRKGSENDVQVKPGRKEDVENKGRKSTRNCVNRGAKKKVLEEANNSKLRQHVQVRVEDCLQNGQGLSALCRRAQEESEEAGGGEDSRTAPEEDSSDGSRSGGVVEPEVEPEAETEVQVDRATSVEEATVEEEAKDADKDRSVVEKTESEEDDCVIVSEEKKEEVPREETRADSSAASRDDDEAASSPLGRMELGDGTASLLRFADDRSDSGVSSLRSGSGDERSGSRSSALSSSDEPQPHGQQVNTRTRSPVYAPQAAAGRDAPVRVWRDPSLLLESEPHVRHIHSVQHQSLLMSHPAPPPATAPSTRDRKSVV